MASIAGGADVIVACGGDGTVNEVASCLVKTSVVGLLPIGSGNGLARHLTLSTHVSTALETIKRQRIQRIDVGIVNNRYFFCNISVAFSAQVIHCYSQQNRRGFSANTRAFLKAITSFSYKNFELAKNDTRMTSTPFDLLFSNTNQLSYNRALTPDASLFYAKLDMIRVERTNPLFQSTFMFFAFFRKCPPLAHAHHIQLETIRLRCPKKS